jgi:hypothetical protein
MRIAFADWIRVGLVPGVWGLIDGGGAAAIAEAMGADATLSRAIAMLTVIAVSEGMRRHIRNAAERDIPDVLDSHSDRYEEPESAKNRRR